ncbi:MAG: hypothetical protein RML40_12330, partial [Bacteroidota bacterium]|nr:hypothetical protein [Candidatus Kapabacteria bacterium]MDW8221302.1 hypothetical protein [Bacteroidota bacterium]
MTMVLQNWVQRGATIACCVLAVVIKQTLHAQHASYSHYSPVNIEHISHASKPQTNFKIVAYTGSAKSAPTQNVYTITFPQQLCDA